MAKKSREKLIAELDARKISYSEDMKDEQLVELLKQADEKEKTDEGKPDLPAGAEESLEIDYSGIRCGLATIQDLHRRITILERKINNART